MTLSQIGLGHVAAYCLVSFGLTYMIQFANTPIWARIRNRLSKWAFFHELFDCPFCIGTWSGLALAPPALWLCGVSPGPAWLVLMPGIALASSSIGMFGYLLTQLLSRLISALTEDAS